VVRVVAREPFGGPLWVEAGGQRRAIGMPLAGLVHGVIQP
jgi:Fe2+ transport system protein FeoA